MFVTGTGTGIGKTYVAAQLIRHLRRLGATVRAFKPVVTGYSAETVAQTDCAALLDALAEPHSAERIDVISPWRFRAALGPIGAAALEGRGIDFEAIAAFTGAVFRASPAQYTIVEGLGGVMVPFDEEHTLLDLLSAAAVPAIVVTGTYLGALSHSLTALEVLFARGIPIATVIVNETDAASVSLDQTAFALAPFATRVGSRLVCLRRNPTPCELASLCEAVLLDLRAER
jgi:dethiobiotin synthetase